MIFKNRTVARYEIPFDSSSLNYLGRQTTLQNNLYKCTKPLGNIPAYYLITCVFSLRLAYDQRVGQNCSHLKFRTYPRCYARFTGIISLYKSILIINAKSLKDKSINC